MRKGSLHFGTSARTRVAIRIEQFFTILSPMILQVLLVSSRSAAAEAALSFYLLEASFKRSGF